LPNVWLEGESVLWVGRPRQSWLVREDLWLLPLAISFLFGGFFVFGYLRLEPHPQLVAIIGGAVALGAAAVVASRVWFKPQRRRRTWYAITNLRAVIVESGRYLVSYALRVGLEIAQVSHRDGITSIHFGTREFHEFVNQLIPPRVRRFDDLSDADAVHKLMRAQISANSNRESEWAMLPVARAVPVPLWRSDLRDVSDVTSGTLNYQQPFREKLRAGEQTLWVARPPARPPTHLIVRWREWPLWVVSAVLFTIAWMALDPLRGRLPADPQQLFFGVIFLIAGGYVSLHRMIRDTSSRGGMWYTLTTMRVLIVREEKIMQTLSLWPPFLQGVILQHAPNGSGTILFDLTPTGRKEAVQNLWPCFTLVPEAQSVHDLLVRWMQQSGQARERGLKIVRPAPSRSHP
jgi:hypothetical protein